MALGGRSCVRQMALDGSPHHRGIAPPERGAALDIGEEEGDGTRREIRHGVLVAP